MPDIEPVPDAVDPVPAVEPVEPVPDVEPVEPVPDVEPVALVLPEPAAELLLALRSIVPRISTFEFT